ncbi:MAG: hypothetical protein JRN59_05730 [Nitrososphaerota archaeon]|nr:hypothetical protein [Nitrososphaerota archaeon]
MIATAILGVALVGLSFYAPVVPMNTVPRFAALYRSGYASWSYRLFYVEVNLDG